MILMEGEILVFGGICPITFKGHPNSYYVRIFPLLERKIKLIDIQRLFILFCVRWDKNLYRNLWNTDWH